jgi:hypothetical protein
MRGIANAQRDPIEQAIDVGANVPQAWAAGSVFSLLQAILGIVPDAPRGKLHIAPLLPAWLPVGRARGYADGDGCRNCLWPRFQPKHGWHAPCPGFRWWPCFSSGWAAS